MAANDRRDCPICGVRSAMRWTDAPLAEEYAEGVVEITGITYQRCEACGETLLSAEQARYVEQRVVEQARYDLDRLPSADIHRLRLDLGLTQAQLEAQLGVGQGTVGRWERGTVLQNATADRLMRVIWMHPELVDELGTIVREGRGPYRKRQDR